MCVCYACPKKILESLWLCLSPLKNVLDETLDTFAVHYMLSHTIIMMNTPLTSLEMQLGLEMGFTYVPDSFDY